MIIRPLIQEARVVRKIISFRKLATKWTEKKLHQLVLQTNAKPDRFHQKKLREKTTLKRSIEFRRPRVDERRTLTLLEPASKQSGRKSSCWMATTLRGNSTTCSRDRECSDHTCRNLDRPPPTNSLPSLQLTHDYRCCSIQHQHWRFLGLSITRLSTATDSFPACLYSTHPFLTWVQLSRLFEIFCFIFH